MSYNQISRIFGGYPCTRTVMVICRDFQRDGRVIGKVGRRGIQHEGRKFDSLAWELLMDMVNRDDQMLLYEMADLMSRKLGQIWSVQDISKALEEAGFVRNAVFNRAAEARHDLQAKYKQLCLSRGYSFEHYVFIDEVGTVRTHDSALPYRTPG